MRTEKGEFDWAPGPNAEKAASHQAKDGDEHVKRCTRCEAEKPRTDFARNSRARDGLFTWCRACSSEKGKAWRAANRDRHLESVKKWRSENQDRVREYNRKWMENNREYFREYNRQWRERNRQRYDEAQRRSRLKSLYGLTVEEYDAMLSEQGGVCLLCHEPPREGLRLCVDHCHATGEVRGLLCRKCNRTLGLFADDLHWFMRAAGYLATARPTTRGTPARRP